MFASGFSWEGAGGGMTLAVFLPRLETFMRSSLPSAGSSLKLTARSLSVIFFQRRDARSNRSTERAPVGKWSTTSCPP